MLLSALSKFVSSLLVSSLVGVVLMLVLGQTLFSGHYLEGKLAATNSYQQLSTAITNDISQKTSSATGQQAINQQTTAVLATILTPQVLQAKINSALDQLQAYYCSNGPAPTIDLTDLAAQAQAAGVPVPADSGIAKPISLGTNRHAKNYGQTLGAIRSATVISMVALTAVLVVVCWRRHKWVALPNVLISVGVLLGLLAVLLAVSSNLVTHAVQFNTNANAFTAVARALGIAIAKDLARRLGIIAVAFGVIGIVARIWLGRVVAAKPPMPPAKPTSKQSAVIGE